ncbi:MAG: hypothetical protein GYA02_15350 [Clostridiaceae bacterium]|nr:hypothetical protein [Clostridiaceae bacterium]
MRIPKGSTTEVTQNNNKIETVKLEKDMRDVIYGLYELNSGEFQIIITIDE